MARYFASATAVGGRDGLAASSDGRLRLHLDRPKVLGGYDRDGTNPEQLFAAAYAACFLSTIKQIAADEGIDLAVDCNVSVKIGIGEAGPLTAEIAVDLAGLDESCVKHLIGAAHLKCPYSNAIRGNVEVKFTAV